MVQNATILEEITVSPRPRLAVRSLATFTLSRDSPHARRVTLTMDGRKRECVAAQFGPSVGAAFPDAKLEAAVVLASPPHADATLGNDPTQASGSVRLIRWDRLQVC